MRRWGDRVRSAEHSTDPGVFIRSMSGRGHLGGLPTAAPGAVDLLSAIGFDVLLVETVGVWQKEVAVMPAGGHRGAGARMKSKANDLRHRCAMSRGVPLRGPLIAFEVPPVERRASRGPFSALRPVVGPTMSSSGRAHRRVTSGHSRRAVV